MDRITNKSKLRKYMLLGFLFFLVTSLGYAFYLYSRATTVEKLAVFPTIETSGNIEYIVEVDNTKKKLVKISGWSIIQGEPFNESLSKYILFSIKDKNFYEVRTWTFSSKNVIDYYHYSEDILEKFHYNYAGMCAVVNKKHLKAKGEYRIYILFDNGISKRFFDSGSSIFVED